VFIFQVNAPDHLYKYTGDTDSIFDDGWKSIIHYRTVDLCNWAMPSIAMNEAFGTWQADQSNNWSKPEPNGVTGYAGYNWTDEMSIHLCNPCNPDPTGPQTPLSPIKVDHASQTFKIGSATVEAGVPVQTKRHQRYVDHGRHE
jgi:hypothetical protein